jgi:Protein of unknown function (DUF2961)
VRTRKAALNARVLAVLVLVAVFAAAAPSATASAASGADSQVLPGWSYGAAAATALSQLPELTPTAVAGGQSSFDRDTNDATHGNTDYNNFLASGARGHVMLDQQGPGCVYRIWMTSLQSYFTSEWVKIYFDGAAKPAIDMTIGQMFSGIYAPFLSPLVDGPTASSGGYVSYVPLCYRKSIEITTNMDRYYNIGYVTYAPNANVQTWTPSTSTAAMRTEWDNVTSDPISTTGNSADSGTLTVRANNVQQVDSLTGPATIQSIKISVPGVTASAGPAAQGVLDHLWIRAYWDGQKAPSVDAPLGSFFAMGQFGSYPTHGLVAGINASNTMYMYLPMPFLQRAVIQLVNTGSTNVTGISYQIQYRPLTGDFRDVGYFKTSYTTTSSVRVGRDLPILSATGSGKFVGVTASYTGDPAKLYLEGDERIYVDGSGSPAFYGTGTEDFFNGAFYFINGPFSQPMSGNTADITKSTTDETAAYRFFLQDAIPFRRGIVVTIQHGPYDNTTNTSAAMLAYYYERPAVQSVLTDSLAVANAASERAHHYVIHDQAWHGSRTYQYEGTADTTNLTDSGRGDRGYSQFTMAIAADNQGVDLRRRYDQGIASQEAKVYVAGHLVGTWFVAGANIYHRWADTDFLIPAAYTRNRSSITIKVQYVAGSPYLTEYRYWAYSLVP